MQTKQTILAVAALILFSINVLAQQINASSQNGRGLGDVSEKVVSLPGFTTESAVSSPHWTYAVFAAGGTGLNDRSDVQFAQFGVRGGRVLTCPSGRHWYSGTLEYNAEFIPYTHYFWKGQQGINGFAVNPLLVKWNFTGTHPASRKLVPFFEVHGGFVKTTRNLPPGDTKDINFTSGAGVGVNYFLRPNRALSLDMRALHLSNASLGRHNPGINASLQWTIGYTWYKR